MIKRIVLTITLALILGTAFTVPDEIRPDEYYRFSPEYHIPKVIIACFSREAVSNLKGSLDFTVTDNKTSLTSFNQLAQEYRITQLKQMHPFVGNHEWNENGTYIQNIYRLELESNKDIEEALRALESDENILWAEYEPKVFHLYTPNDPMFSQQIHHPIIKSPEAWDYVKGSDEVIVAITDTGAKWNHPDLADNIWINEAELPGITIDWENGQILGGDGLDNSESGKIDDVIGWDFVDRNNNPYQNYPGNSHGTHVAGIAGAVGDNNVGITGVAMNVSLLICKGAPTNAPSTGVRHAYEQMRYSADSGAHIINCSWISYTNQGNYANSMVTYATDAGALVVAGNGNDGVEHTPSLQAYPADATDALSVAATTSTDRKAGFSDYGEPTGISAPGVNILSTWRDDGYNATSGTSMASPVVAGVAALVKSLHPDMPPRQLKNRLQYTADNIDDLNPNYAGLLGTGRVNAFTATMYDKIPQISLHDYTVTEYDGDGDGVPNPGEEIGIAIELYNEMMWAMAEGVTAQLSTEAQGVTFTQDTVQLSDFEGGSFAFNHDNPFRFKTDPDISDLHIPFTLTITSNGQSEFPYEVTFDLDIDLSLQRAGWPLTFEGSSSSPAFIKDINGDEVNEIVFGDSRGNLHVVREDKSYLDGFPVNLGTNINSGVAAADLNNNGRVEIVANTLGGIIFCVDYQGGVLFRYDMEGQLRNNPMLADVNNNGNYEIIAASVSNPKLAVIERTGRELEGFPIDLEGTVMSALSAVDLNGDGSKEIIFATSGGMLHAISSATTSDIDGFPVDMGGASWTGPTIGDVTGNKEPEIAIATINGDVFVFDNGGNALIHKEGGPIRTGVLVFDINNDGNSELIYGDVSGNLYVLDNNGEAIHPFPLDLGYTIESTPILADLTRDGNFEIIFGDVRGNLHAKTWYGDDAPNFPLRLNASISVSPTIGYVGETNKAGILLPNQRGYNYIEFKRDIGSIGWATFQGNAQRTGNFFDVTSVEEGLVETPLVTALKPNYPNPFNPNTTISFDIGQVMSDVPVNITIYNIRGQKIRTLVDDNYEPGNYSIVWNGRDDTGARVSSGVYFYRLLTTSPDGVETQTRKMMMMK